MSVADVSFRYVGLQTKHGEVYGLCLGFSNQKEAADTFRVFQSYITAPSGLRSLRVAFTENDLLGYDLIVDVMIPEASLSLSILGIDPGYVGRLRQSLDVFTYYVILAGYDGGQGFELLPPADHHLFKRDVVIDGEVVLGQSRTNVHWPSLLTEGNKQ